MDTLKLTARQVNQQQGAHLMQSCLLSYLAAYFYAKFNAVHKCKARTNY